MDSSVIIIILVVIVIIYCVIRKNNYNKVETISKNIQEAKNLNSLYYFNNFHQKRRRINYNASSLSSFRRIDGMTVLLDHITNNIRNIQNDIKLAIENRERYLAYENSYNNINFSTDDDILQQNHIKIETFKIIEGKIMRKIMIKNVYNISCDVYIFYTSPKRRNSYSKKYCFNYNDIFDCYNNWENINKYKNSAKYERAKMSDSIRYNVLKRDNFKCKICGATANDGVKLHVDHIIPISKGGKTTMDNLQTLCERCNIGKSNKL